MCMQVLDHEIKRYDTWQEELENKNKSDILFIISYAAKTYGIKRYTNVIKLVYNRDSILFQNHPQRYEKLDSY